MVGATACPFCDDPPERGRLRAHLELHMRLPFFCRICDALVSKAPSEGRPILCDTHSLGREGLEDTIGGDERKAIDLWISRFVDHLNQSDVEERTPFDWHSSCETCESYKRPEPAPLEGRQSDAFADHLRHHLRYFSFSCDICDLVGTRSGLLAHIQAIHRIGLKDNHQVMKPLEKIRKLDQYLEVEELRRLDAPPLPGAVPGPQPAQTIDLESEEDDGIGPKTGSPLKANTLLQPVKESSSATMDVVGEELTSITNLSPDIIEALQKGKTLQVIVEKISSQALSKYQIVRNCRSQVVPHSDLPKPSVQIKDVGVYQEVKIPIKSQPDVVVENGTDCESSRPGDLSLEASKDEGTFFCIFCRRTDLKSLSAARMHYQEHLDYYPYKCHFCDEVTCDIEAMFEHFRNNHPEETEAKMLTTKNGSIEQWIPIFLGCQTKGTNRSGFALAPRKHCPVCDKTVAKEVLAEATEVHTSNLVNHIYKHLCYEPYNCVKCEANGKQFRVIALAIRPSFQHVVNKHPEDVDSSLSHLFTRSMGISVLDKYIGVYLRQYGIKSTFSERTFLPNSFKVKLEEKRKKKEEQNLQAAYRQLNGQAPYLLPSPAPRVQPHFGSVSLPIVTPTVGYSPFNVIAPNNSNTPTLSPASSAIQSHLAITYSRTTPFTNILVSPNVPPVNVSFATPPANGLLPQMLAAQSKLIPLIKPNVVTVMRKQKIVVELSPFDVNYDSTEREKEFLPDFSYFCIFCRETFSSKIDAVAHFGHHLTYLPVICILCSQRFTDLNTLNDHFLCVHPNHSGTMSLYIFDEDPPLERWCDEFLDYQKTDDIWKLSSPHYVDSCPVCKRLIKGKAAVAPLPKNLNIFDHIYRHLKYFTFECNACKESDPGKITVLPALEKPAEDHLQYHDLSAASPSELSLFYSKSYTIPKLEKAVSEGIVRSRCRQMRGKRRLKEDVYVKVQPSSSQLEASHRDDAFGDGLISSPPLKKTCVLSSSVTETVTSSSIYCFHCHVSLRSVKELKEHHNQNHISLSMILYSPEHVIE